jgi:membrane-bound lytic murein transglycosylase A
VAGTARSADASPNRVGALVAVDAAEAPVLLDDGDPRSLRQSILQSLAWLARQPPEQRAIFGPRVLTVAEQRRGLRRMLDLLADEPSAEVLAARVLAEFDLLKSVGQDDGMMLATGYHERSSTPRRCRAEYRVPILGIPDLRARRPGTYLTRAEIDKGGSAIWPTPSPGRDPLDVFFMEIEGSGTLRLPSGAELRVGHGATNGRPYRSIARLLIDEGKITREAMTMRALRAWLAAHPEEQTRVLQHNESYVFFHRLSGAPPGSLGVPLTPGRSIATDPRVFPRGALAFIRTARPVQMGEGRVGWKPVDRFVLSQDAGGAIRGPGRVDIFWGRGPDADLAASDMKEPGELYFLVPKERNVASPPPGRPWREFPPEGSSPHQPPSGVRRPEVVVHPRGSDRLPTATPGDMKWPGTGGSPYDEEVDMLAIWVKVRIKPTMKDKFLKAIEVDALGSERDEAGCLRFNVLQDAKDENVYYFYEIYKDEAAIEAHRAAPHYDVWRAAADSLDGPTEVVRCTPVFPAARPYWGKV